MFLGTHTPRLDEKGRLFLPAKFRDRLADGLVITRGQERCLYVFPMDEFVRVAEQLRAAPVTSKAARDYLRVFLSGACDEMPDKQGRVTIPAVLREYAGLTRDCTVIGAGSRLEIWDAAAWTAYLATTEQAFADQAEEVLPGSSDRLTTGRPGPEARSPPAPRPGAPSPAPGRTASGWRPDGRDQHPHRASTSRSRHAARPTDEGQPSRWHSDGERRGPAARAGAARPLRRAARPGPASPGSVVRRRHARAWAGTPRRCSSACPRRRLVGLDRDPQALALAGERLAAVRRPRHLVHAVYDELPRRARRPRARHRVQGVLFDLGRLLAAARRGRARLRLRRDAPLDMRMDQSDGHHRRRGAQHLLRRRARRGSCASTARSGSPAGSPTRSSRERERRAVHHLGPAGRAGARSDPGGHPQHRRPPGQAHLPGAADRGQRRARGAGARRCPAAVDALAVGGRIVVLAYHSLEDRLVKQRLRRAARTSSTPPGLPVELPEHAPYLRLLTRGAEAPSDARGRGTTRAPPRPGCGPPSASEPRRRTARMSQTGRAVSGPGRTTGAVPPPGRAGRGSSRRTRAPGRGPRQRRLRGRAASLLLAGGLIALLLLNTAMARAPSRCTTCRPPPASWPTPGRADPAAVLAASTAAPGQARRSARHGARAQRRLPAPLGRPGPRRGEAGRQATALPWSRRRRPRRARSAPAAAGGTVNRRRRTAPLRPARPTRPRCGRRPPSRRPRGERVTQSRGRQGAPVALGPSGSADPSAAQPRRAPRDPQRGARRAAGRTRTRPRPAADPQAPPVVARRRRRRAVAPVRRSGPAAAASPRPVLRGPPWRPRPRGVRVRVARRRPPPPAGAGHVHRASCSCFSLFAAQLAADPGAGRLDHGRAGPRQPAAQERRARPAR